jgi:hypothetical protein
LTRIGDIIIKYIRLAAKPNARGINTTPSLGSKTCIIRASNAITVKNVSALR